MYKLNVLYRKAVKLQKLFPIPLTNYNSFLQHFYTLETICEHTILLLLNTSNSLKMTALKLYKSEGLLPKTLLLTIITQTQLSTQMRITLTEEGSLSISLN